MRSPHGRALMTDKRRPKHTEMRKMDGRHSWTTSWGSKMDSSMACFHNKVKLCSTWDHYPVHATIQGDEEQGHCTQQKKKGWAGWKEHYGEARKFFKRIVVDQKGDAQKEGLETMQRRKEEAAKKVAPTTDI